MHKGNVKQLIAMHTFVPNNKKSNVIFFLIEIRSRHRFCSICGPLSAQMNVWYSAQRHKNQRVSPCAFEHIKIFVSTNFMKFSYYRCKQI